MCVSAKKAIIAERSALNVPPSKKNLPRSLEIVPLSYILYIYICIHLNSFGRIETRGIQLNWFISQLSLK